MKLSLKKLRNTILLYVYSKINSHSELYYMGTGEALPPPLSKEEEKAAFSLLSKDPEQGKRLLIEHNLRLVVYIAGKFDNTGVSREDLTSIGTIGLIKAVNTFDVSKNIKLATYASRCIENEILMYLRRAVKHKLEVSLDEPLNVDSDGNELLLCDILGADVDPVSHEYEAQLDRELLIKAINRLKPREKEIITLRYGLSGSKEYTQKQVADMMGISQSYISRLEKRILAILKKELSGSAMLF